MLARIYHRFVISLISIVAGVGLITAVVLLLPATATSAAPIWPARPVESPLADCGSISCTTYLPVILGGGPAPAPAPAVTGLEVTQGIQQPNNSVILIENRETVVRYSLTSTVAYTGVEAFLHGRRGGVTLPGSPLVAFNNPRTLKPTVDRKQLDDTFNFEVPKSWARGDVTLYAEARNSSGFNTTSKLTRVRFTPAKPMPVTVVPIAYKCETNGTVTLPQPPYDYLTEFTYSIYPVSSIPLSTRASVHFEGPCTSQNVPNPDHNDGDWGDMLYQVTAAYQADGYPERYYYGLLGIGGNGVVGIGWIGYPVAMGRDGGPTHSNASQTHAHEVAHNHNRRHAEGCDAQNTDPNFPYTSAGKSYLGDTTRLNYGFDRNLQIIYPHDTYEIMSYCRPQWVSDYTYQALWDYDNQSPSIGGFTAAQSERALLVSGAIDPDTGLVTFNPVYALDGPGYVPQPGDYSLDLVNSGGNRLATYPFAPLSAHGDRDDGPPTAGYTGFHLAIPYANDVAEVRIRRGEVILGRLTAGPSAPVLDKGIGALETDTGAVRVTWSASDTDGEELRYLVRASTDGGTTWQTISVSQSKPAVDLLPFDFGGQMVLVEVLASDGLNTTPLRLGPFVVPGK